MPNAAGAVPHAGPGDADGEMRLAGPRAADQNQIALMGEGEPLIRHWSEDNGE